MQQERAAAGTVAAIMAAGASAAYGSGNMVLGTVFAVIALLALVATFASRIRVLNRLPVVGAPPPPKEVTFGLEGHDGLTFEMPADGRRGGAILRIEIPQEGRTDEISRVTVNAYVVGATHITRTLPSGSAYPGGGGASVPGQDGPYWSISGVTITMGPFLLFFKVTIPEPGEYEAVVTLQSPDFYDKGDHFYGATLTARESGEET